MSADPIIAVIDDDLAIRKGVSSLLRSAGYAVEMFESAESFLDRIDGTDVRVVLSDVQMAGMSGLDLQAKLRSSRPDLPFLIMTAFPEPALRAQALAGGALCFLSKPFNAEELLGCIERALQR